MSIISVRKNWQAGTELVSHLRRHRQLTWEMTRRELTERYSGQILGIVWTFIHPLIQLGVYIFVFGFVFAIKMGGNEQLPRDYITYLLAGMIPWFACAEALAKGTGVLVGNANLVKQVVFPLEVLPVKSVLATFITQLISTGLVLVYSLVANGGLPWTVALLPTLFVLQTMALIGMCCVLSTIGAYFRDLREFVQISVVVGIYLMPVVYLPAMVPAMFRGLLYLNPFSYLVWCYQDAVYFGRFEHPVAWVVFPVLSLACFSLGYRVFRSLKPMVGNVL